MDKRDKKNNTIFLKTFKPVFSVLFITIAVFTIVFQLSFLQYLKTNAIDVFNEQVTNRKIYVESEMGKWTSINSSAKLITQSIEDITAKKGESLTDIHTDPELNQEILRGVMDDVLGNLRTGGTTEIFLILDGCVPGSEYKDNLKQGIYIRNSNPDSYSSSNESLLFERGMPMISKQWQLPLDSFWTSSCTISDEEDSYLYTKPLEAAKNSPGSDASDLAYWCYSYPISESDRGVLSYSIPLIASDGTVLGVYGVGISEDYFVKTLNYRELGPNKSGAYLLAKTTDGVNFESYIYSGSSYNKASLISQTMTIKTSRDSVSRLYQSDENKSFICVSAQYFTLYNNNTPFENERWALLGIQNEDKLLSVYNNAQTTLMLLLISALIISAIGIFRTSRLISNPIRRLVEELRKSDPNRPIKLNRVNVDEIDELVMSIESLSSRVAAAFSKISTIIQMSESGIGIFEYKEKENLVFCNPELCEMIGFSPNTDLAAYIDGTEFIKCLKELDKYAVPGEENLYEVYTSSGRQRWLKLNQTTDESSVIGVLIDITSNVLEKRQIEYERDYDILTSIYNRRAFEDRVNMLFKHPDKLKTAVVILWDLDNLKFINDNYGHSVGDSYIISLANCLKKFNDSTTVSARRSGDEFITLIYGKDSKQEIREILKKLQDEISAAYIKLPNGNSYKTRVSAGMAWCPSDSAVFAELFQYADFAMYTAKHNRKGTLEGFNPELYKENRILVQGQEEFNNLMDKHLVRYMLQPIISVSDGGIFGYEMLMRSEVELFKSPADILKMAHSQSKLYDLEVMTWFEAMKTFVNLKEYGMLSNESKVFINSVSNQLMQPDMIRLFEKTYSPYLQYIVCELTEEDQRDSSITHDKTELFRNWNSMIAIDDYGCGYNSEAILLETSPDIVKIDISIVHGVDSDEDRRQLVKNLISYAKERNIMVLGEGVETKEEAEVLISLGVDLLQGFYLARPSYDGALPSEELLEEIRSIYKKWKK